MHLNFAKYQLQDLLQFPIDGVGGLEGVGLQTCRVHGSVLPLASQLVTLFASPQLVTVATEESPFKLNGGLNSILSGWRPPSPRSRRRRGRTAWENGLRRMDSRYENYLHPSLNPRRTGDRGGRGKAWEFSAGGGLSRCLQRWQPSCR